MPYSRQRPRLSFSDKISARFSTLQRDLLIGSNRLGQKLGYTLHHAAVREGKLSLRLSKQDLETVILAAAQTRPADPTEDRLLRSLLKYLESLEDRFEDPEAGEPPSQSEGQDR